MNLDEFLEYGLMDGGAFAELLEQDSEALRIQADANFREAEGRLALHLFFRAIAKQN